VFFASPYVDHYAFTHHTIGPTRRLLDASEPMRRPTLHPFRKGTSLSTFNLGKNDEAML